jgi:hypothetical protein
MIAATIDDTLALRISHLAEFGHVAAAEPDLSHF